MSGELSLTGGTYINSSIVIDVGSVLLKDNYQLWQTYSYNGSLTYNMDTGYYWHWIEL